MVILEPRLMSYDDVEGWRIEVKDGTGNIVRSERGFGGIPGSWHGREKETSTGMSRTAITR